MGLEELKKEIKRLQEKEYPIWRSKLMGIKETIEAIESLCIKEEDGLEVYENRYAEGKGDGIWVNAKDLIEIKMLLDLKDGGKK